MRNLIVNLTATGGWQELPTIPHKMLSVALQARGSNDMYYRYRGQTDYWTIKADTTRTLIGQLDQGDLYVQGTVDDVIEAEYSTIGYQV